MKMYRIQFYKKKAGNHHEQQTHDKFSFGGNKDAYKKAREELIRIANCDISRGVSESSEEDILAEIQAIQNGTNTYCYDQTTCFFKVFTIKKK